MSTRIAVARDIAACALTVPIQREVWGEDVVVPPQLLQAVADNGGLVALGYVEGDEAPAGFVFGFLGIHDDHFRHHSHMLAVRARHRGSGIAVALKEAQRDHCLDQGVEIVTWTMDPLEALNAHFNLAKLGAYARTYLRDHYGDMPDKLNAGLPSDRFYVEWPVGHDRTYRRLRGDDAAPTLEAAEGEGLPYLLRVERGRPAGLGTPAGQSHLLLEIPSDFQSIRRSDRALALAWRHAARSAFEAAFEAGYAAVEFLRSSDGRGAYLLVPQPRPGELVPAGAVVRLERVELFIVRLPLKRPYETSGSVETHQTHVIARAESEGAVGWGESVAPELPWYSGETPRTVWYALTEIMIPRLLNADLAEASQVDAELAWIREHRMAKATIETAVWDLFAKRAGVPLARLLGGTRDRILCGVAIGLHPTVDALLARIDEELKGGYQRVKLKIKPGRDVEIARAVRKRYPDLPFMLDANSAYTLDDAAIFQSIDEQRPTMIEQPLASDDIIDHATLQRQIRTPICLDESIHSSDDARKAIEIGATRVINIKTGRVGGLTSAKRVHDACESRGLPVWCGGMLEMGIGRAHNVHLASLPNFSVPGDVAASARYFDTEIIGEPFTVDADGTMKVPTGPGIGVTVLENEIRKLSLETRELRG